MSMISNIFSSVISFDPDSVISSIILFTIVRYNSINNDYNA